MATAAMDPKRQEQATDQMQNQSSTQRPPAYYVTSGPSNVAFGGPGSDPICYQNSGFVSHTTLLQPNQGHPTVMVTQPVVVGSAAPPDTTCAFVMSTLSAIFCNFWCGTVGILLAWKAKLHALDKKYEHARHSLRVVWLFFGLACLFGACVWIMGGIYLYLMTHWYYW